MPERKKPTQGRPFTSSLDADSETSKADTACGHGDRQQPPGTMVHVYRIAAGGYEYYGNPMSTNMALKLIYNLLPRVFASHQKAPKLNPKARGKMLAKLSKAADAMGMGILLDVRLLFPVGGDGAAIGFHRSPNHSDRYIKSVEFIGMNRRGQVSEPMRGKPTIEALEKMAQAFGMQGVDYV